MGIQRSQDDSYVKELAKWEQRPVFVNGSYIQPIPFAEGGRGDAPRTEYPKMLYQADSFDGGPRISGVTTVADEAAEHVACGQGWCVTQEAAIAGVAARHREFARLAAERAHTERWMSEAARAEAQAKDEATMEHLPSIPETPIKKRGRPVKVAHV